MLEFFWIVQNTFASWWKEVVENSVVLTTNWIISIIWLVTLFAILITEKIDKTIVSVLIAGMLIFLQVFSDWNMDWPSSQLVAFEFIYKINKIYVRIFLNYTEYICFLMKRSSRK